MKKILIYIFCAIATMLASSCNSSSERDLLKSGDVIFMRLAIPQVKALKSLSQTDITHVGVIFVDKDSIFVYESAGIVTLTPIEKWVGRRTTDSLVYVKRLKNELKVPEFDRKLINAGFGYKGKETDYVFSWSDSLIYNSELVWKMFDKGLNIQLSEPKLMTDWNYKDKYVASRLKQKYNLDNPVDTTTQVVSPDDLFNSPKFELVYSGKGTVFNKK